MHCCTALHGSDEVAQAGSEMRELGAVHVVRVEEGSCQVFVVVYDAQRIESIAKRIDLSMSGVFANVTARLYDHVSPSSEKRSGQMPFGDGTGSRRKGRGLGRGRGLGMGRGRALGLSTRGNSEQTAVITIDSKKCTGCGTCISVCPTGALSIVNEKAKLDQLRCRNCRACVAACPTGAIT